jgi:hypothetical protein
MEKQKWMTLGELLPTPQPPMKAIQSHSGWDQDIAQET